MSSFETLLFVFRQTGGLPWTFYFLLSLFKFFLLFGYKTVTRNRFNLMFLTYLFVSIKKLLKKGTVYLFWGPLIRIYMSLINMWSPTS